MLSGYLAEGNYGCAAISFIAAIPMLGDAIGLPASAAKYACTFKRVMFGLGALGNLDRIKNSLKGIGEIRGYLAQKHLIDGAAWDMESAYATQEGLLLVGQTLIDSVGLGKSLEGFKNSQCFVAGTLVLTSEGNKPIEEIKAGDLVYSTDPETGESEYKEVVQTFENETEELVHVTVDYEEIVTTPKHPFYVPHKGWTSAIDLRAGDILVLSNGEYVIVEKVQHEILESPVKVYNFEVRDYHTYYVGDISVLVHNSCKQSKNPNGYSVEDVDDYERMRPNTNRANGNRNTPADGRVQAHHIIQDKWAKSNNIPGYNRNKAPAILLETGVGKPHTYITNSQRARKSLNGGYTTSIGEEFRHSYNDLLSAGVSSDSAKKAMRKAYKYFDSIGAFI